MNWYKIAMEEGEYDDSLMEDDEMHYWITKIASDPSWYEGCPYKGRDKIKKAMINSLLNKIKWGNYGSINNLYADKGDYQVCKLRREMIKVLFNEIKKNPEMYYQMRHAHLHCDLQNDLNNIAKHLKLPIAHHGVGQ